MENKKINIAKNIEYLRKFNKMSIEDLSEKLGVSRQTISKWENGQSYPDIINSANLAELFDVNLDDLLYNNGKEAETSIGPKGKHIFGTTTIGERGQIVIPKKARDILGLKSGDSLTVLGDEDPVNGGIALVRTDIFMATARNILDSIYGKAEDNK